MTCGIGWKKRSVRCRTIQGVSADEAACRADLKPLVLEPCKIAECTSAHPVTTTEVTPREDIVKWRYGRWTEVSGILFILKFVILNYFLNISTLSVGLRICWLYPLHRGKISPCKRDILGMTLNCSDGEVPILEL